ncbi:MAG: glycosyltransferase family 2 protein [Candidatus Electryonea clarkiae]|nr:glycosyltransferase family 2 protein [Candidatus Electryonea clarkiae]MDP8289102.1 glycosyltransferase family 2 protein [Candidatus Electryonea clarkiae]
MHRSLVYAILPAAGAVPGKVVQSLMALRRSSFPIIYIHNQSEEAPLGPDLKPVPWVGETTGSLIETARKRAPADFYLWIPPGVMVIQDKIDQFVKSFEHNPEGSLFVSDYMVDHRTVSVFPLQNDLTEREDWGAVWGFPAWALEKIDGADQNLKYTAFYDLKLKLMEIGPVIHIDNPTYRIDTIEEKKDTVEDMLFFPGQGAYGGFSYLFIEPEEEQEIEEVFLKCLHRRGAYIEARNNFVKPSPVATGDPVVSVIIPVHNRAHFLPYALESVLSGTFENFEILIIDNASTDNTHDTAAEYVQKDHRIRLFSNQVNLISKALNIGVENARGRYIAQLDSDDEYTPHTLQKMVDHLENHPDCGLAISYYELMNEQGETLEQLGVIKHEEYNLNNILRVDGAGALRCWHKSVIEEFGGFNEVDFPNYGEDYDLVLKVGEHYDVDRVQDVLYRYRRHPGNTDALRKNEDKIRAKTFARTRAIERRRILNDHANTRLEDQN